MQESRQTTWLDARAPVITPLALADLDLIDELERRCFPSPWSQETYRRELEDNRNSAYWVIRPGALAAMRQLPPILAYGGIWLLGDEAHIMTIASHPDFRRHKLGEWLLLHMLAEARRRGACAAMLEVREHNEAAVRLYAKMGFVLVGRRKEYYPPAGGRPAEDALLMTLFELDVNAVWAPLARQLQAIPRAVTALLLAG